MSEPELKSVFPSLASTQSPPWRFLAVRQWIAKPTRRYLTHLEVAQEKLFKVFRLSWLVTVLTVIAVGLIGWGAWLWEGQRILQWWNSTVSVRWLVTSTVVLALGFVPWASRTFKVLSLLRAPSEFLTRVVLRGILPVIGSLFVWIHLTIFDRLFLYLGRVRRSR